MDFLLLEGFAKAPFGLNFGEIRVINGLLKIGGVCVSWHYVIKDNQNKRIKMQRYHQVPMLFIPCEEDELIWTMYDIMDNKFLESKINMSYDKHFCASSEGWLVAVNKDYTVSLYNPYSMLVGNCNNIQLPILFPTQPFLLPGDEYDFENVSEDESEEDFDYHIFKATITADPLENPNDCTIVVIFGENFRLAFIRLGKDTTWTKVDGHRVWGSFEDILSYNNHFYALDTEGELISFDVDPHNLNVKSITTENLRTRVTYSKRYLVKSCKGDILQVERYLTWGINTERIITEKFNVFKLDMEQQRWIGIKDLGDESLFLGDNSSISISTSNFVSCQCNCIYFTHDQDLVRSNKSGHIDIGVYNMETESSTLHFNIDSSTFTKMFRRAPIWLVPTINLY
ncbi:hypothetical protein UlMin_026637 [Ulmus minor]